MSAAGVRLRWCRSIFVIGAVLAVAWVVPQSAVALVTKGVSNTGKPILLNDGVPWKPVGYNDYRIMAHPELAGDGCGGEMSSEDFKKQMDRMQAYGTNTIRTWFFQEYWQDGPASNPWKAFDRVLKGAKDRGMKVIPVLSNQFAACDRANDDYDYVPPESASAQTKANAERQRDSGGAED